jgi:hypothetical protein
VTEAAPPRQYGPGPDGLHDLFADLLESARKDERGEVHDQLARMWLTDGELAELFGSEAASLKPRYKSMMETLTNRGGIELVAQIYERKLDDIEVVKVDGNAASATPEERAVQKALRIPVDIYAVRVKRKTDARGLRYDFFVYLHGAWRTGNQLGKVLAARNPPDGGR